ncbi:hypothetical protein FNH22_22780 [Fulvivirga sp. M361]|uniref:hypothetical protein n=1 Tax=Fulvivirga sp. M361 TaxID=2594266 RepID=UPI00117AA501|nr:hypothetical protein [Fulvivirga sp. M361]TRX52001.1 hypothetical protein FNH22_22780 [Fulvivirga sp. M361]
MANKLHQRLVLTVIIFFTGIFSATYGQEVGLSFSYFLPKNGYFSVPISPFSLRGVGVDLNRYFALQTGFSLYRMSGLNIKDIDDFSSKDALVGPNFTVMIPVELVLQFVGKRQEFRIKGGGFGFGTFDNKLNNGNLDKAIREFEGWDVANADFDFDSGLGFGYFFGAEYIFYVTRQWGLSLEGNYFIGDAGFSLNGSYTGGNSAGPLETKAVDYADAKLDFTGLEISIGIIITQ